MKKIMINDENIIFYYGNKAGYIKDEQAIVDPMFNQEMLIDFLTKENRFNISWKEGVFDALINNSSADAIGLKTCRIHQLKADVDVRMKFISYDELIMRGFGKPNFENYIVVFDGDIDTNDLHKIYEKFNISRPHGYNGHSLSMSDVIELYDSEDSSFYYVDSVGFKEIMFADQKQEILQENQKADDLGNVEYDTKLQSESYSEEPVQSEQEEQEIHIFTL